MVDMQMMSVFTQMDADGDGKVTFEEFANIALHCPELLGGGGGGGGQYPWLMLDLRFCYITCAAVVVTVYWPSNPCHEMIYTTGQSIVHSHMM